jgi:MoaA/NifB/PqqE/SkfB family radical SAM enzyme
VRLPNLKRHAVFGGGEATLFWGELLEMLQDARSHGFVSSLVTNGWWGKSKEKAEVRVGELERAGVARIDLSIDAMHEEFVHPAAIDSIIEGAKAAGMAVVLRICTTRRHRADDVLALLSPESQIGISVALSAVTPLGRARDEIGADEIWIEDGIPGGACHEDLNLAVTPSGDVFPCCAGSELCASLCMGNVFRESLEQIMRNTGMDVVIRTLVHRGPASFVDAISRAGLGHHLRDGYTNYCHLCNDIFTNPEVAEAVRASLPGSFRRPLPLIASSPPRG